MPGRFFGPYPNAVATRETLLLLQRLFRLRPCEDTFFANRSRPCLQYQIGRCTGPCVGLVTREQYAQDVADAIKLLEGRDEEVIEDLGRRMEAAAGNLAYEEAARLRDQISTLKQIQATQVMTRMAGQDIDAVGIAEDNGEFCVSVVFARGGRNLGSSNFFPKGGLGGEREVLSAFLAQFYLAREAPAEVLVQGAVEDADGARAGAAVESRSPGSYSQQCARHSCAVARDGAQQRELGLRMRAVQQGHDCRPARGGRRRAEPGQTPQRLECFDVSHSMGESPVASCVVLGPEGPDQERLSALQLARHHAGRRLRRYPAGCAKGALRES